MNEDGIEKYADFLDKVSEILGLNKPVDVLRLCTVTDEYFKSIKKYVLELEKENLELEKHTVELRKENDKLLIKIPKWHKVVWGDLPKECESVLCYCKGSDTKFYRIGHVIIGGDHVARWWTDNRPEELDVIAWRELPKLEGELDK